MRGRTLSLSGKTLLAPTVAGNGGFRESKLSSTVPISSKPSNSTGISPRITKPIKIRDLQSISTSNITITSKENMILVRKQLDKLYRNVKEITLYNHAKVFSETNIVESLNTAIESFRTLYHDAVYYYKSIKAIEEAIPSNRVVSNAQLKSSTLTFRKQWQDICTQFNTIKEKGVTSLNDYITLKFHSIKQLLAHVATYTKVQANKDQIEKSTIKMQETMLALSKSTTMTLTQRDAVNEQPTLMETPIRDIRSFNQQFNEACFNVFTRCGVQQSDLKQLKQDIISGSNEIVIAIRAGFSFDKDMNMLTQQFDKITEFVDTMMDLVELPPSPVRSPLLTSRRNTSRFANTPVGETITPNPEYNGVVDMVEKFVTDIQKDFKLEINPECDVFEKLEEIRSQLLISYKPDDDINKSEVKFADVQFQTSGRQNELDIAEGTGQSIYTDFDDSFTQTTARSTRSRRVSNMSDPINLLEAKVAKLEEELKKKDEEINELKQTSDQRAKLTLEKAINKMSGILSDSDGEFVKDGENAEKLQLFVVDRKCPICAKREVEELEIVEKARDAFLKVDATVSDLNQLPQAIDELVEQVQTAQNEVVLRNEELDIKNSEIFNLNQKLEEQNDKITAMQMAQNTLKQLLYGDNPPSDDMDVAAITMNAFNELEKKHKNELKELEISIEKKHREGWEKVYETLKISKDEGPQAIYNEFDKQNKVIEDLRNQLNQANGVLKRIEAWMRDHATAQTQGMGLEEKFQSLMFAIDEAPNPLSLPYEELMKERRQIRSEIEETVTNLAKQFHTKLGVKNLKTVKIAKLMELHKDLTGKATGDMGAKIEKITKLSQTIEKLRGIIVKQCNRLWEFLEVPPHDFENNNIEEMMNKLAELIEKVCCSGSQNFVSKEVINKAVVPIRKHISSKSNDPRVFIPEMVKFIMESYDTFTMIYTVAKPLEEALGAYDFTKMPEIGDKKFSHTRECVFRVNAIVKEAQEKYKDKQGYRAFDVLNDFVSLTCALFSLLASQSFGTPGANVLA
ncbi:hypothetical protein TVAG_236620 [Trichomonas vaginalis G3]|uniref:Uncharacterized protein n=1 Tax=Trichomonas vaginalis (strain ATCC PRA-98 / G3) TaxID=412133 RepID=A2F7A2_TRIV3|nr:hypothetical protein TVAGG3_0002840 [Trichomonas vaginalis G3]EAX99217.1 hypothetical protein TVAG_236620 [Trichomonas vaginalis G3]KAI5538731.1 hypothetical protein TVAGG3_0002840 [Trichomonas vaginalis G3]|eukprot:XP_001312147.1 hypothetical protein [Trichomonas vaginalis G3]